MPVVPYQFERTRDAVVYSQVPGTTNDAFVAWLRSHYPRRKNQPALSLDARPEANAGRLFVGEVAFGRSTQQGDVFARAQPFQISVVADPIARVQRAYDQFISHGHHADGEAAPSLPDFLSDERYAHLTQNTQTHWLARLVDADGRLIHAAEAMSDQAKLYLAKETLYQSLVCGIAEEPTVTCQLISSVLGKSSQRPPEQLIDAVPAGAPASGNAPPSGTAEQLASCCHLDAQLYAYARELRRFVASDDAAQ